MTSSTPSTWLLQSEDLKAASPAVQDSLLAVAAWRDDQLVAIAAVLATPTGPAEVSILVDPAHRGQRLATTTELGLINIARHRWQWLQHRTIQRDVASQKLAAAGGFRLLAVEHLVRPRRLTAGAEPSPSEWAPQAPGAATPPETTNCHHQAGLRRQPTTVE